MTKQQKARAHLARAQLLLQGHGSSPYNTRVTSNEAFGFGTGGACGAAAAGNNAGAPGLNAAAANHVHTPEESKHRRDCSAQPRARPNAKYGVGRRRLILLDSANARMAAAASHMYLRPAARLWRCRRCRAGRSL